MWKFTDTETAAYRYYEKQSLNQVEKTNPWLRKLKSLKSIRKFNDFGKKFSERFHLNVL